MQAERRKTTDIIVRCASLPNINQYTEEIRCTPREQDPCTVLNNWYLTTRTIRGPRCLPVSPYHLPYHLPVSPYPCITVSPASLLLDPAPNCSSQRGVPKRRLHYELLAGPITQHALECARSARSQRGCGSRRPSELNLQDTAPHRTNHTRTCTVLGRTHQLFGSSTGIDSSTGFKPSLDETSLCTRALQTRRQAPPRDVTAPAQSMTMM